MTATTNTAVKKGSNPRWKTGQSLGMLNVPEGYKGRWCDSDEAKVGKKLAEGWEFVNKTNFPQAGHLKKHNQKDVKDAEHLGGAVQYRELVGMMLPIEDINGTGQCVKERERHYDELTKSNYLARIRADKNKSELLSGSPEAQQAFKGSLTVIE